MTMLFQLIFAGLLFWTSVATIILYFSKISKIAKKAEKSGFSSDKVAVQEMDERKLNLKNLSKNIYWIQENIKYDKDERPDLSFNILKDLRNIIEKAYTDKNISASVYDKFAEAFVEIIDLMIQSVNKKREIRDLSKNSPFRKVLKDQREQCLDQIDDLTNKLSDVVTKYIVNKIKIKSNDKIVELKEELIIDQLHREKINELNSMLEGAETSSSISLQDVDVEKDLLKITHEPNKAITPIDSSKILSINELTEHVTLK